MTTTELIRKIEECYEKVDAKDIIKYRVMLAFRLKLLISNPIELSLSNSTKMFLDQLDQLEKEPNVESIPFIIYDMAKLNIDISKDEMAAAMHSYIKDVDKNVIYDVVYASYAAYVSK